VTQELRFSPLLLVNLRAFADAQRLFGRSDWWRGTRLSFNVLNAFNDRQSVRDPFGATPLQYQPAYRDPIGRTVELEIRKVF
jgi:iron complex outermembrane recepter protein